MSEVLSRRFLISVPQLTDPNFHRSVVLIVEHGQHGALGLVINRPSSGKLQDLLADNGVDYKGSEDSPVMIGGPVQPTQALLLHGEPDVESDCTQVGPDLRLSGSVSVLRQVYSRQSPRARLYFGYAGWGPGQLEAEIEAGAWLVAPVDPVLIFDTPSDDVWERALRGLGIDPSVLLAPDGSIN
jgi:putative transcriptional regulator